MFADVFQLDLEVYSENNNDEGIGNVFFSGVTKLEQHWQSLYFEPSLSLAEKRMGSIQVSV